MIRLPHLQKVAGTPPGALLYLEKLAGKYLVAEPWLQGLDWVQHSHTVDIHVGSISL